MGHEAVIRDLCFPYLLCCVYVVLWFMLYELCRMSDPFVLFIYFDLFIHLFFFIVHLRAKQGNRTVEIVTLNFVKSSRQTNDNDSWEQNIQPKSSRSAEPMPIS